MFAFIATFISIPIVYILVTNKSIFGMFTITLIGGSVGYYIGHILYSIFIIFFTLAIISSSWRIINIINNNIKS